MEKKKQKRSWQENDKILREWAKKEGIKIVEGKSKHTATVTFKPKPKKEKKK